MSSLTAFYLMFLEKEEDTFWMLVETLRNEKYDLQSIFSPGFPGLHECFFIHEKLLAKELPKLSAHLVRMRLHSLSLSPSVASLTSFLFLPLQMLQ
jgi:hypothetical protein